jgi:hypothetical protein
MKFKYGNKVIVETGFHKGRTGKITGRFLFWTEVLFDNQFVMSNTILTKKLKLIGGK